MIRFEGRYDEYAYRVSTRRASAAIKAAAEFNDGQWVTLNNDGEVVVSDGTSKSFIATSSKRDGRDNITTTGMIAYLMGTYELSTDQFDTTEDYTAAMTPLKVDGDGKLTPWDDQADGAEQIEAYSISAPVDGFLRIAVC